LGTKKPCLPHLNPYGSSGSLQSVQSPSWLTPFAAIPTFRAIAGDEIAQRQPCTPSSTACFTVLSVFAAVGPFIFRMFGLTLPVFEIAGGLILLLIRLDMLPARRSSTHETPTETREGVEKPDARIAPLGIPMLAGPGAISRSWCSLDSRMAGRRLFRCLSQLLSHVQSLTLYWRRLLA
jgi:small neutral amino acid transporter SnatA (MarC family)